MSREEQMTQAFYEEAGDLLPELESALLELEETPGDSELVNRVFRALHTIKGSGAMFGFDAVADFTHEVETVFDMVRNGDLQVTTHLLDLTLQAKDHIQRLLYDPDSIDTDRAQQLLDGFGRFAPARETSTRAQDGSPKTGTSNGSTEMIYRIRFKPGANIFATGTDPLNLIDELAELGRAHVIAHTDDIPMLSDLDPESCNLWWDVILTTSQGKDAIRDVFIFVEDESEIVIQVIDEGEALGDEELATRRLGEILVERGDLSHSELHQVLISQKPLGAMLSERGLVSDQEVHSALVEQSAVREARQERKQQDAVSSIRVSAAKLDQLVDLVGELVIAQARLSQTVGGLENQELNSISEEIERLSDELRDSTLGIRMLPIGSTFSRFRRVVRDLSSDLGKEIELETEGADTELDKTVIERLGDPLVHLLRNAIDHGIEAPGERERAGKPRQGKVTLSAMHSGGNVLICITDDGQGMDLDRLRQKAVERGIISDGADLSDKEVTNLIFAPGFSTASKVTDVSGRGVGMDVVRSNIESLRGSVEIESQPGQGCTVRVKLPLTLAIIDGLQVQVGEDFFVLPLHVVEECIERKREETDESRGQEFVQLRGEIVPFVRLRQWFMSNGVRPDIEQIVVVSAEGKRIGLVVDEVIGQFQTVIKSLSKVYRDVEGISGATIRGDGSMALIIDTDQLIQSVEDEVRNTRECVAS